MFCQYIMKNFDPQLAQFLDQHSITFEYYEHIPVFTVEESEAIKHSIPGTHTKNLFLTDKKWWFFLVSIEAHKRFPVNLFRKQLGTKELSFASAEDLYDKLHLTPWSVSLCWLLYDTTHRVHVYLDYDLWTANQVGRHPNRNDATLVFSHTMIEKFLEKTEHTASFVTFDETSINIS